MQTHLFELPKHVKTFDDFWEGWPNKVDRKPAEKAWNKAIQGGAKPMAIIKGRDAYIANKPGGQAWLHGATFLNQRRWEAEYPNDVRRRDDAIEAAAREVFG